MKYINRQKYSECQLVSAINAAIFLGETPINTQSPEYERLVDLVGARYGSAIFIEKAYEYLRLSYELVPSTFHQIRKAIDNEKPIEITVYHNKTGPHSALVVNYKNDRVKVVNFRYITSRNMWTNWETLKKYIYRKRNIVPNKGKFKSFDIDGFYK